MDRGAWWATVHGIAKSMHWARTYATLRLRTDEFRYIVVNFEIGFKHGKYSFSETEN